MRGARVAVLLGVVLAAAAVACEPLNLGTPPADINACRPSQAFFVDEIWPNFLSKDYGGVHCYDATCHGGASSNSLRLIVPLTAATLPLSAEWYDNYISVTQQMKCTNVAASSADREAGLHPAPHRQQADRARRARSHADQNVDLAALKVAAAAFLLVVLVATTARAEDQALVRVVAEQASVRTGPGFGYRVVHIANLGEVLTAIGRATNDHWFRVELPDGTYGWILGAEVFPLDVDTSAAHRGPSIWKRMGNAMFSPSPLTLETVGFTFSAGVLGGDGMFLFRPSVLLAPHVSLEAFVGETVGNQLDIIYTGGGFNAFLFPTSPVTPFVGAAAGGAFGRPKADQFVTESAQKKNYSLINVGGGLIMALKKRLTIRGDVRHYVIYNANNTQSVQEYSGALAVFF